ncbi:hypothetical protein [Streptomyces sp. N35]|uniref:hypothetical protein n=1 Tax=Streptomyces sp. N35 TaxID=2795730 RepID=UPI0027DBEDDC|nr:hypothetical protein [Streptomyces sp. N35]
MSVSTGTQGGRVPAQGETRGQGVSAWRSLSRTLGLILFAWVAAVANTAIAYLTFGKEWIPITVGLVLCLTFTILLILLHRAWWLAVLSLAPALFVLVGSVQLGPDGALEHRGVRESVVVVADSAAGTSSKEHRLTLRNERGEELAEKLVYRGGAGSPDVGDALDILRDPDGRVPMEQAAEVDSSGQLASVLGGTVTWTLFALLAGWRGHVRRRMGRELADLPTF